MRNRLKKNEAEGLILLKEGKSINCCQDVFLKISFNGIVYVKSTFYICRPLTIY